MGPSGEYSSPAIERTSEKGSESDQTTRMTDSPYDHNPNKGSIFSERGQEGVKTVTRTFFRMWDQLARERDPDIGN